MTVTQNTILSKIPQSRQRQVVPASHVNSTTSASHKISPTVEAVAVRPLTQGVFGSSINVTCESRRALATSVTVKVNRHATASLARFPKPEGRFHHVHIVFVEPVRRLTAKTAK